MPRWMAVKGHSSLTHTLAEVVYDITTILPLSLPIHRCLYLYLLCWLKLACKTSKASKPDGKWGNRAEHIHLLLHD